MSDFMRSLQVSCGRARVMGRRRCFRLTLLGLNSRRLKQFPAASVMPSTPSPLHEWENRVRTCLLSYFEPSFIDGYLPRACRCSDLIGGELRELSVLVSLVGVCGTDGVVYVVGTRI